MAVINICLGSIYNEEISCQRLLKDTINKNVSGDTVLTSVQLLRRRLRVKSSAYEVSELECSNALNHERLYWNCT